MSATVMVRNLGPFDRDIRPGGRTEDVLASVPVGGIVEVSADLAKSLAEQDCWEIVKADTKTKES